MAVSNKEALLNSREYKGIQQVVGPLIIIEDIQSIDQNSALVKDILSSMEEPIHLLNQEIYISAYMGIAHFPADGEDVNSLIQNAETAANYAVCITLSTSDKFVYR